jgi:hypothetical protein
MSSSRNGVIRQRNVASVLDLTHEANCLALRRTAHPDHHVVAADQRAEHGGGAVAFGQDLGDDLAAGDVKASEMSKGGIAAEHHAVMRVHHAAAGAVVDLVLDLVEPIHRDCPPGAGPC